MKIIVNGALGRMGSELVRLANAGFKGSTLAAAVDPLAEGGGCLKHIDEFCGTADVIIDFSNHAAAGEILDYAMKRKLPVVIATTGHTEDELAQIRAAAKFIPVFFSANMSLGIAFMTQAVRRLAKLFPDADVEIVETHHKKKLDSPSGTALMLANAIADARGGADIVCGRSGLSQRKDGEIGISSIRRGNIAGIHKVIFSTPAQTLTFTHEVHDKALFAQGAVEAADYLIGKPAGLYGMSDIFEETV